MVLIGYFWAVGSKFETCIEAQFWRVSPHFLIYWCGSKHVPNCFSWISAERYCDTAIPQNLWWSLFHWPADCKPMVLGNARWTYRISTIQTLASSLQSFDTVPYKDDPYESPWGHDISSCKRFQTNVWYCWWTKSLKCNTATSRISAISTG